MTDRLAIACIVSVDPLFFFAQGVVVRLAVSEDQAPDRLTAWKSTVIFWYQSKANRSI
jgi:hypothetical protein